MKAAIWRLVRVVLGQVIGIVITATMGINIPYLNIGVGAVISALAKLLRDKLNWDWLPV